MCSHTHTHTPFSGSFYLVFIVIILCFIIKMHSHTRSRQASPLTPATRSAWWWRSSQWAVCQHSACSHCSTFISRSRQIKRGDLMLRSARTSHSVAPTTSHCRDNTPREAERGTDLQITVSAWSSYDTFTSCRMEGNYWLDSHGDEYKMLLVIMMRLTHQRKV